MADRTKWTPELIEVLKRHIENGKTTREVGLIMGCGHNAVVGVMHRFNIKSTRSMSLFLKRCQKKRVDTNGAQREPKGCRYIAKDPRNDEDWGYCQKPIWIKPNGMATSYCKEHHKLCIAPNSPQSPKKLLE